MGYKYYDADLNKWFDDPAGLKNITDVNMTTDTGSQFFNGPGGVDSYNGMTPGTDSAFGFDKIFGSPGGKFLFGGSLVGSNGATTITPGALGIGMNLYNGWANRKAMNRKLDQADMDSE